MGKGKQYLLVFIVASAVTFLWSLFFAGTSQIIGLGGGSAAVLTSVTIIYFAGYPVLTLVLAIIFNKTLKTTLISTFIVILLPMILLWVLLYFGVSSSKRNQQTKQREYQEFRQEALKNLPINTRFSSPLCSYQVDGNRIALECELSVTTNYDFNRYIFQEAFEFRINDFDNKSDSQRIVEGCQMFNHFVRPETISRFGEPVYKPGTYQVNLQWWFDGDSCTVDNLKSLIGKKVVIRSNSRELESFVIDRISGR